MRFEIFAAPSRRSIRTWRIDPRLGRSDELQGLDHLVKGLARIASLELHPREAESLEAVPLKDVLNDLRIIVEPSWSETGGTTRWELLNEMPRVMAERHGLLQVFLNLAHNSQRAVQETPVRELTVSVSTSADRAVVRFQDSGCGIAGSTETVSTLPAGGRLYRVGSVHIPIPV